MARRLKSIKDIRRQANRIFAGLPIEDSKRAERVLKIQDRYVNNIMKAQDYDKQLSAFTGRSKKAVQAYMDARAKLQNQKVSRNVYMGLAGSKG